MTLTRFPLLPVLLFSTALCAQYEGEPPILTSPLAEQPNWRPATFGLQYFSGMTSRAEAGGSRYFVISGQQSRTTPSRMKAWRLSASLTWTPLTDVDAVTHDGDGRVSISHDLLAITVERTGAGIELLTRTSTSLPFQSRRAITALPADAYAPALARIGNSTKLFVCTTQPPAIELFDLSTITASVFNPVRLGHALTGQNTRWAGVTTVDDPAGDARGLLIGETTNLGIQERWGFAASLDANARLKWFLDAPRENRLLPGMQMAGGSFLFPCLGLPPFSAFPDSVLRADMVFMTDHEFGRNIGAQVIVATPKGGNEFHGTAFIGFRGNGGIDIGGLIKGRLALDPLAPMVVLPVQRAVDGYVTYTLDLSTAPIATVDAQSVGIDAGGVYLGASARLRTR